jgi:hypothetical protein
MKDQFLTWIGTTVGTVLSILGNIQVFELTRVAVYAAVGAAVSFTMTVLLQKVTGRKPGKNP